MILVGNQRGNYVDAARHFMNTEDNENVVVHEISGFMGNDLYSAFQESYACSRATKCSQHLYSLSLSPPKDADVSVEEFKAAIDRAEQRLGLTGQPRAIVFHEKRGRDGGLRHHAHAVWCRVDTENGKAIHMSFDHSKLFDLSHELFLEHGWELPTGYENKQERSPLNYTHAEYQQAKRRSKYADDIKRMFQDAWQRSDTPETFATALKEKGYVLACGGHAAFVAVDGHGEVYSLARLLPINTKEIRSRLNEPDHLPTVEEAELQAHDIKPALRETFAQEATKSQPDIPTQAESPIAKKLKSNPEHILSIITDKESHFTHRDIAKGLNAYLNDADEFRNAYENVITSNKLVALNSDPAKLDKKNIRYSTREMVDLENTLMRDAKLMAQSAYHSKVSSHNVEKAIETTDSQLQHDAGVELSHEQKAAIRHVTGNEQLSSVIGVAGAGKSTILAAAPEAWEAQGYRVFGAALAGKAAKGLEQSSGIQSRTLASFELSWQNNFTQLKRGDVLVIDEAGMIGSKQMAKFVTEVKDKGAKLVLVGDAEQLQPINAGAPFRNIIDEIKPVTLHEVHRQKEDWQKQASKDLALGKTQDALKAHMNHDNIDVTQTRDDAIAGLSCDYLNDFWEAENKPSQLALAHRKVDVKAINQTIRERRKEAGELVDGNTYQTAHGRREFATGDRLLFTRNDRDVGVKNGMLGTVVQTDRHNLSVEFDDKEDDQTTARTISIQDYADIEYGYATTIHKSQGATVDKSYVLASNSMDRHLTYVAMTRHRQNTTLYVGEEEFPSYERMVGTLSCKRQKQSTLDLCRQDVPIICEIEQRKIRAKIFEQRQSTTVEEKFRCNLDDDLTPDI